MKKIIYMIIFVLMMCLSFAGEYYWSDNYATNGESFFYAINDTSNLTNYYAGVIGVGNQSSQYMRFDGTNDYAAVADYNACRFNTTTPKTVVFWIQAYDFLTFPGFINCGYSATSGWLFFTSASNLYMYIVTTGTTYSSGSMYTLTTGNWTMISFTIVGNESRVYINGNSIKNFTFQVTNSVSTFWIGRDSGGEFLNADIDGLYMANESWTSEQMKDVFNQGHDWKMNKTSPFMNYYNDFSAFTDKTGNGHQLQCYTGMGVNRYGYVFDGADDYCTITPSIGIAATGTMGTWFTSTDIEDKVNLISDNSNNGITTLLTDYVRFYNYNSTVDIADNSERFIVGRKNASWDYLYLNGTLTGSYAQSAYINSVQQIGLNTPDSKYLKGNVSYFFVTNDAKNATWISDVKSKGRDYNFSWVVTAAPSPEPVIPTPTSDNTASMILLFCMIILYLGTLGLALYFDAPPIFIISTIAGIVLGFLFISVHWTLSAVMFFHRH